jgi:hypothetical protein
MLASQRTVSQTLSLTSITVFGIACTPRAVQALTPTNYLGRDTTQLHVHDNNQNLQDGY